MTTSISESSAGPQSLAASLEPRLDEGILREPVADGHALAVWLPLERDAAAQIWERIGSVPHTEFTVEPGIQGMAATAVRLRQNLTGRWSKIFQRFRRRNEDRNWVLPDGSTAEQIGQRRNDLLLVWCEDVAQELDPAWLQTRWPTSQEVRKLGRSLLLVYGVTPPNPGNAAEQARAQSCPNLVAERLLGEARQAGDRRKEILALMDLGLAYVHQGQPSKALETLEQALTLSRQHGESALEGEIVGNLGLAWLRAGQPMRALPLLEQRLAQVRASEDRFAARIVLDHLGWTQFQLGGLAAALTTFEEALALARALGQRAHEAESLWSLAIIYAELRRQAAALEHAQAAVSIFKEIGHPYAGWFAEHLRKYQRGEQDSGLSIQESTGAGAAPAIWNGAVTPGDWLGASGFNAMSLQGPGWLRMALSAAKSMAKFIGSGMKTVPPAELQRRLRTCAACVHHTRVRCRLCGCFTAAKARMAHEECPVGKWPA